MKGGFGSISDIYPTNESKTFVFYQFLIPLVARMGAPTHQARVQFPDGGICLNGFGT